MIVIGRQSGLIAIASRKQQSRIIVDSAYRNREPSQESSRAPIKSFSYCIP